MRSNTRIVIAACIACASAIILTAAASAARTAIQDHATVLQYQPATASSGSGPAMAPSVTIAEYDFDDGLGGADPQGWTSYDRHRNDFNYFHVDDFAGLAPDYAPLSGAQSLWCGIAAWCDKAGGTLPGYGNNWRHSFTSREFAVTGNVVITYIVKWDVELDYDFAYLQYLGASGTWETLLTYTGIGQQVGYVVVNSADHTGTIRFRFVMDSDQAYSDEDGWWPTHGAIIIDDLIVADDGGTVDFQDFESEGVGDQTTADGDWTVNNDWPDLYGDYAALMDGSTVLQEDPVVTNNTWLWGFFSGSTANYACAGHPEQLVVPYARTLPSSDWDDFIDNDVRSPMIDISTDVNGAPLAEVPDTLLLEFDVYRGMTLNALVFYAYDYRFSFAGCSGEWHGSEQMYYADQTDWFRFSAEIAVPVGATHIQVALRAVDMCVYWCGTYGDGTCHSQGPLFDNVRVGVPGEPTAVGDTPVVPRFALRQNAPNPFNGATSIRYEVPAGGGVVELEVFDAAGRRVASLFRGFRSEGVWTATWDGRDRSGREAVSGVYFCRLAAPGAVQTRKMLLLK